MGLSSFMGHRLLAIFLAMLAISLFLSPAFSSHPGQAHIFGELYVRESIVYFLALISGLASAYFFKTQH